MKVNYSTQKMLESDLLQGLEISTTIYQIYQDTSYFNEIKMELGVEPEQDLDFFSIRVNYDSAEN